MITNGFDYTRTMAALISRIGWKQPTETGSPVLTGANIVSNSGRFFQGFHPLVSPRRIMQSLEDSLISDSDFNTYLLEMQKSCIMACLSSVFDKPQLVENKLIFETTDADSNQLITNDGNFVGVKIKVARLNKYATHIRAIQLYFDTDATFNIYLFHSSKKGAVKTQSVSSVANELTVVKLNDFFIDSSLSGEYYLGYFQDDIGSANAIHVQDCYNNFCILQAKHFESKKVAGQVDFERKSISEYRYNYGLNAELGVYHDFTKAIEDEAHLFDEAIGLSMTVSVIELLTNSLRISGDEAISEEQARRLLVDLNVSGPTDQNPMMPGIKSRLNKEFKKISNNFFPHVKSMVVSYDYY